MDLITREFFVLSFIDFTTIEIIIVYSYIIRCKMAHIKIKKLLNKNRIFYYRIILLCLILLFMILYVLKGDHNLKINCY